MPSSAAIDPIPPHVRSVLDLFENDLSSVVFPGLDGESLGEHAEEVHSRAQDLEEARRALEEARLQLETSQEALLVQAKKGLAYARIYAESDADLQETLATIELSPAAKKVQKRTRKVKSVKKNVEELPLATSALPSVDASSEDREEQLLAS